MSVTLSELVRRGILEPAAVPPANAREFRRNGVTAVILVPAGPFVAGATLEEARCVEARVPWYRSSVAECPQLRPTLGPFLIDRHEVTCSRYAAFLQDIDARPVADASLRGTRAACDADGTVLAYDAPDFVKRRGIPGSSHAVGLCWSRGRWVVAPGSDACPVVLVTWEGAMRFAARQGFRLPTEFEWEKAARGPDGRRFPWGDTYEPDLANTGDRWLGRRIVDQADWDAEFYRNGEGRAWLASQPLDVGSFPGGRSACGCDDMIGNVAEWCQNWYREDVYLAIERSGADLESECPESGFRAMRGAGRYGFEAISRCSCRRRRDPRSVSENLGFRCALDVVDDGSE